MSAKEILKKLIERKQIKKSELKKKSSISFIYFCILAFSQLPNTIPSNLKPNTNHTIIYTQIFFSILSLFIYLPTNPLRPLSHRLALFLFLFLFLFLSLCLFSTLSPYSSEDCVVNFGIKTSRALLNIIIKKLSPRSSGFP